MTKQQILNDEGFKFISSLPLSSRYYALFESPNIEAIKRAYNASIELLPFGNLGDVDLSEDIILSVEVNPNMISLALIHPLDPQ